MWLYRKLKPVGFLYFIQYGHRIAKPFRQSRICIGKSYDSSFGRQRVARKRNSRNLLLRGLQTRFGGNSDDLRLLGEIMSFIDMARKGHGHRIWVTPNNWRWAGALGYVYYWVRLWALFKRPEGGGDIQWYSRQLMDPLTVCIAG